MSDAPRPDPGFEARLARLERLVEELRTELRTGRTPERPAAAPAAGERSPGAASAGSRPPRVDRLDFGTPPASGAGAREGAAGGRPLGYTPFPEREQVRPKADGALAEQGERWLGRLGVAFVVLALAFLFKYSLDQGWITPALRLLLGLVVGSAMLVVGLRLEGSRERYSQLLLGGAIGVFYLVGFAAYQLYEIIPFLLAFPYMATVTVVSFVLAERQSLPSLAVLGATGGLSTPFLLQTGSGNVPGLVVYTTLLLSGAGAVWFRRGWRALLFTLGVGGLIVMAVAAIAAAGTDRLFAVFGVVAAWALFGVAPLVRAHVVGDAGASGEPGARVPPADAHRAALDGVFVRLACVPGALIGLSLVVVAIDVDVFGDGFGAALVFGAGAVVYAVLARRLAATRVALDVGAEVAVILATLSVWVLVDSVWAVLPLTGLVALMHLAAGRWRLEGVRVIAFTVLAVVAAGYLVWSAGQWASSYDAFTLVSFSLLAAIGIAFAASFAIPADGPRDTHRVMAHVAVLIWLATEFGSFTQGQALISLSWGVYGIVLLLASFRMRHRGVQLAGLATLGLVAGKLLIVDMAQLDMIWRILLFMGFGAAFLGLSYLINRRGTPAAE